MFHVSAEHILAAEAKEAAQRQAAQEHTERVRMIGVLQRVIADNERRKESPIFTSEEAETTFQMLKADIDRCRENYIHGLWTAKQSGRAVRLNLESADAQAFFNYENAIAKLALLADLIASRNGRGQGIDEAKRAAVISDCDAMIADAKEKLAALNAQG